MMEMLALFVGYFLYESNADIWWWIGFWVIMGVRVVGMMLNYRRQQSEEIAEAFKYWEGK